MWLHLSWRVWRKGSHLNPGLDLFAATTAAHAHPSGEASASPLTSGRFCPSTIVHREMSVRCGQQGQYQQPMFVLVLMLGQRWSGCVWHRFGVKWRGLGLQICLHFDKCLVDRLPSRLIRQLWKDIILIYEPNFVSGVLLFIAKYLLSAIISLKQTFSYRCPPIALFMLFCWANRVHSFLILEVPDI